MRAILTIVVILCAVLTRPMAISRREGAIKRNIQDLGGGVIGYESQDHFLKPLIPSFLGEKIFLRISDIQFGAHPPTADLLEDIATLTHVRKLSFAEASDQTIQSLPTIETLEVLGLSETSITDNSLYAIGTQPNLTSLSCLGTNVTDDGLERLSKMLELETSLAAQRVTQELMRETEVVVTVEDANEVRRTSRQNPEPGENVVAIEFPSMPPADVLDKLDSLQHLTAVEVKGFTQQPPREVYDALSKLTRLKKLTINNRADIRNSPVLAFASPSVRALPGDVQMEAMQQAVNYEKERQDANTDNLMPLGNLTELEELTMSHGYKTSHAYLEDMHKLHTLTLNDAPCEALEHLKKLPKLKNLNVHVLTQVTDRPISETELISKAKSIEHLTLRIRSLVDEDLKPLANMPNLKTLSVLNSKVKGPGIKYLTELTNLEKVDIPTLIPSFQEKLQTTVAAKPQKSPPPVEIAQALTSFPGNETDPSSRELDRALSNVKHQRQKLADQDFDVGREWERHAKLGAAWRAAGKWEDAARSYGTAIEQLIESVEESEADGTAPDPQGELRQEIGRNSYVKALIEFDAMNSKAAAIVTLKKALNPKSSVLPTSTAGLAASTIRRAHSNPGRADNNPFWHLASNTRMLAYLYGVSGDHAKAYETWKRYVFIQRSTGAGQHWVDPIAFAKLKSAATSEASSNDSPTDPDLFLTVTDKATKFDAKSCANASWQVAADDQPFIGIIPPASQQLDALAIRLPKEKTSEVWCGGSSKSPQRVMLNARPHPKLSGTFSVKIPFNTNAVFVKVTPPLTSAETMMLKAKLRSSESGTTLPWRDGADNEESATNSKPFTYTDCWIVDTDGNRVRNFSRPTNEWGTSLCRLADERLLLAFTSNHIGIPHIEFTTSQDGVHWQEPWSFPHNRSRTTDDPIMLTGDNGTISMVFSTFHNTRNRRTVWCTESKDGREWSEPKLLEYPRFHTLPVDFIRRPSGNYLIVTNRGVGRGPNPFEIHDFDKMELPSRKSIARQPRMTFDDNDICHAVGASGNDIIYSSSKDLAIWSPAKAVAQSTLKGLRVKPRLFIDGDRAALIYRSNDIATIKLGKITSDGIAFEDAKFASESAWLDSEMLKTDEGWISIVDASNRKLLTLTKEDLFSAKP